MKKRIIAAICGVAGVAYACSGDAIDQRKVDLSFDTEYGKTYEAGQPKLYEQAALIAAFSMERETGFKTTAAFDEHQKRRDAFYDNAVKAVALNTDFKTGDTFIRVLFPDQTDHTYKVGQKRMAFSVEQATQNLDSDADYAGLQAAQKVAKDDYARPTSRYGALERNKARWVERIRQTWGYSRG